MTNLEAQHFRSYGLWNWLPLFHTEERFRVDEWFAQGYMAYSWLNW
jgi:hypothetical protein